METPEVLDIPASELDPKNVLIAVVAIAALAGVVAWRFRSKMGKVVHLSTVPDSTPESD